MHIAEARIYLVPSGSRRPVLLELVTDKGLSGIGEAGVAYGVGGPATAELLRELAGRFLLGRDPAPVEPIWTEIYDHSFWAKGGGGPLIVAAMSAIEQALWDLKGKALGAPVHELLGGRFRDSVEVYANGWWSGCWTPDDYARAGERTVRDGYRALKCYPLAEPDEKIVLRHPTHRAVGRETAALVYPRIKALRDAVGPDVAIMLDLSGALTTDETLRLCRRLEELDIAFIEEPADPYAVEALRRIAEQTSIPIALGERVYGRYEFNEVLRHGAVDILQPDLCNSGGLMEGKKIAALAEIHNARVAPHNCGSTLATAVALQLDACIANAYPLQEFFPYYPREAGYVEVLEDPPEARVRDGCLPIPEGPGLGVTLRREAVAPFLYARIA